MARPLPIPGRPAAPGANRKPTSPAGIRGMTRELGNLAAQQIASAKQMPKKKKRGAFQQVLSSMRLTPGVDSRMNRFG